MCPLQHHHLPMSCLSCQPLFWWLNGHARLPSSALLRPFWGEGSPTKIDKAEKQLGYQLTLTSQIWRTWRSYRVQAENRWCQLILSSPPRPLGGRWLRWPAHATGKQLFGALLAKGPTEAHGDATASPEKHGISRGFPLASLETAHKKEIR